MNSGFSELPKRYLTSQELVSELMEGDYARKASFPVIAFLSQVEHAKKTPDDFYRVFVPGTIATFDEYLVETYRDFPLLPPPEIPEDVQTRIARLNDIAEALKAAIAHREPLKSIYNTVLRFESEGGLRVRHLPFFED